MVAKGNILTAKREIEAALDGFAVGNAATKVFVFETEWQHLRALIGSDGFRDVGLSDRSCRKTCRRALFCFSWPCIRWTSTNTNRTCGTYD